MITWSTDATDKRIRILDINSNGLLGALDVSGLTELVELYCCHNILSAIDVSVCTSLMGLDCNENLLTALDVTDCNATLQYLDVSYNYFPNKAAVVGFTKTWDFTDFIFDTQNGVYLTSADVTVTVPANDAFPDFTVGIPPADAMMYTATVQWWNDDASVYLSPVDKFVGGNTYAAEITITPNPGYVISDPIPVTINWGAADYSPYYYSVEFYPVPPRYLQPRRRRGYQRHNNQQRPRLDNSKPCGRQLCAFRLDGRRLEHECYESTDYRTVCKH